MRVEMEGGEVWGRDHFDEYGFTCAGSGLKYALDDPHTTINGKIYHDDHLPEIEADTGEGEEEVPSPAARARRARRAA